ncbi:histidine phosphatase family protein, partial [Candidatus Parcubacteria bacterium]|nr:histidine phosphatase family protein [Candidatus Parcubacteria bacterium]
MKLNNTYYLLRHGQAISNVENIVSSWPELFENPLTEKGRGQVEEAAKKLQGKQIDIIISSDILRTKETAQIVAKTLGLPIEFDPRLREV